MLFMLIKFSRKKKKSPDNLTYCATGKQSDRPSHVGWAVPHEGKVLWKTTTKTKVLFTEKKVLYFIESFIF